MHNRTRRFATFHPALLAVACVATLALAGQAQAFDTTAFRPLTDQDSPDWRLLVGQLNNPCMGTVITPHVVLTANRCAEDGQALSSVKNNYRYTGQVRGVKLTTTGLLLGDSAFLPAASPTPVPGYARQRQLLQPGQVFQVVGYNADPQTAAVDPYSGDGRYRVISGYPSSGWGASASLFTLSADSVVGAEIWTMPPAGFELPFTSGDDGAGIFADGQEQGLLGIVAGKDLAPQAQILLTDTWQEVYQALMAQGLREDAMLLGRKLLASGEWGENDRRGSVGQIYVYDNPYNRQVEFFRLAALGADQRYGYFPINQQDNQYWQYLGTALPSITEATTPLRQWGVAGQSGKAGDLYIYANPYTREVEFFRLKNTGAYSYFPINQADNADWAYLGTQLPRVFPQSMPDVVECSSQAGQACAAPRESRTVSEVATVSPAPGAECSGQAGQACAGPQESRTASEVATVLPAPGAECSGQAGQACAAGQQSRSTATLVPVASAPRPGN